MFPTNEELLGCGNYKAGGFQIRMALEPSINNLEPAPDRDLTLKHYSSLLLTIFSIRKIGSIPIILYIHFKIVHFKNIHL